MPATYRTLAEREPEVRPPTGFFYDAVDETAGRADGMIAFVRHFSPPVLVSMPVAWVAGEIGGFAALAGAAGYSVWSWRARKRRGGAVLRVQRDVLAVEILGKHPFHDRLRLSSLADVVLDIKTIERVMDGGSAIPAMRLIDPTVNPKVDTARIVLSLAGGREIPLTKDYLPHMHATEWLGKIRTFLRKHGWVPDDERGDAVG
jgi:hypothetical protein